MLRHIKDIKSPIAVANAKHAARREKRIKEGKHITGEGKEGPIRDFTRATRLHHPVVLQPVKGSPNSPSLGSASGSKEGPDRENKDKQEKDDNKEILDDAKHHSGAGYALAIYPYMADREDEFDVAVGDTFAILNKVGQFFIFFKCVRLS